MDASAFAPKRRASLHRADMALTRLPPGESVVKVVAEPQRAGAARIAREVVVAVAPSGDTSG